MMIALRFWGVCVAALKEKFANSSYSSREEKFIGMPDIDDSYSDFKIVDFPFFL